MTWEGDKRMREKWRNYIIIFLIKICLNLNKIIFIADEDIRR